MNAFGEKTRRIVHVLGHCRFRNEGILEKRAAKTCTVRRQSYYKWLKNAQPIGSQTMLEMAYISNIGDTGTSDFRQVVRNTLPAVKMFQEFKNTVRMFSERCAPIFYKIVAAGRVMACHNGRASLVHFRDFGSQNGNRLDRRSLRHSGPLW